MSDDSRIQQPSSADIAQLTADRQRFYDNWKEVEAELESTKHELDHLRREIAKLRDLEDMTRSALGDWDWAGLARDAKNGDTDSAADAFATIARLDEGRKAVK